jgi:SAM-dependent methyltransferase
VLWFFQRLFGVPLQSWSRLRAPGKSPFDYVDRHTLRSLQAELWFAPERLLQITRVREIVAKARAEFLLSNREVKRIADTDQRIAHNTLEYNLEGAKSAPDLDRPMIMIDAVMGIERVRRDARKLDVLSIGPRSEIEIFGLMAAGFDLDRIRALDLFSYSPYVEIGDMHAMPYQAGSFDVIFLGWVLSYSTDHQKAVSEIVRVSRNRTIVVLAGDFSDESRDRPIFKNTTTHMQTCEQLLGLFGGHVGKVYFRHDPELPTSTMVMTIFEVRKQ